MFCPLRTALSSTQRTCAEVMRALSGSNGMMFVPSGPESAAVPMGALSDKTISAFNIQLVTSDRLPSRKLTGCPCSRWSGEMSFFSWIG